MNNDYPSNSFKSREEKKKLEDKKVEKVVKGKVKTKKKSGIQKLTGNIISEDAKSVKSYILMDVLVPAVKDAIEDIVTNGIHMLLRGEASPRYKGGSGVSKISYNKVYDSKDRRYSRSESRARIGYNFDDIVLETRGEAEEVLSSMDDLIERYGIVSVADMYELVGIIANYTDNKYGWTSLRSAEAVRVRDGYLLKLPKVCPID